MAELILGDCLEELNKLEENSIDTCITDPPYHLTSIVERFGKKGSAPAKGGVYERSSRGFMGKCYDKETELLTEDGWLKIDTIVNERYAGNFYSLNPGTNEIELCKATKHMQYKFNGDLLHFTGRSIDLMVTPNHKLWISAYGKKPEFVEADKVPRAFSMFNQGRWRGGEEPEFIEIIGKKYPAKAFMRFLGIYLGDGCVVVRKAQPKKQNFISLSARKERKKAAFKECLEQLGVKFAQYNKQTLVYDKVLNEYLVVLGKAPDKYIPNEYFDYSESLLLELLRGLLETDGYVSKSRKCVQYYTTSKRLADDIQRLLLHCGISGTLIYKKPKEANICGIKVAGSHLYIVTILQNNKKLWFEKTDHKNGKRRLLKVPYSDFVYDVELEKNHILMARRNGRTIWSSNSWDGGDIAFNPQTWEAVYRVLKPGAMLLAFGGTRTYHRLACAIEDAGFVIVDQIAWVYGCLSEDSEVLTDSGFKRFHKITKYDKIKVYDTENNVYKWEKSKGWCIYNVEQDTAYRIKSDKTDQIVSRNHNCLVERDGKLVFKRAEDLLQVERVPYLSYNFHFLQERLGEILFLQLLRKSKRLVKTVFSKRQGKKETWKRVEGRQEPRVERWGYLQKTKRKICRSINKICAMSKRVFINGSQRWLCYGTQTISGTANSATADKTGGGSSYQSRRNGQSDRQFDVIQYQHRAQEIRMGGGYRTTVATIEPITYSGKIFCPTVSTGAFVARRNGKVFITGNSGFPKSHNIGKAIDKSGQDFEARLWDGWGTALKPAHEPICVAMKPRDGTYAENALKWGVAGYWIEGGRIETDEELGRDNNVGPYESGRTMGIGKTPPQKNRGEGPSGRYPANLIHDGSDEVLEIFPNTKSGLLAKGHKRGETSVNYTTGGGTVYRDYGGDSGSAARFFYCAKASKSEREAGLEEVEFKIGGGMKGTRGLLTGSGNVRNNVMKNHHPTIKPIALMEYLVRLTKTPTGGIVLDPFMGSGTTGIACINEGRDFIGIEKEPEYFEIAQKRIEHAKKGQMKLL